MKKYDVLIIGSGPAGEKAAIQASKLNKKVAVIERQAYVGGAGLHTGTLPSKTLRETALYLAGLKQRAVFGFQVTLARDVKLSELMHRKTEVTRKQMEAVIDKFNRNNIEIIYGTASFTGVNTLLIRGVEGPEEEYFGEFIFIASGSRPSRPADIPFDSEHIHDSDTIIALDRIPETMAILGGGVIGCEYACIFAALGVKVSLIEKKQRLFPFADEEVVTSLMYWMRHSGVTLRLNEEVAGITVEGPGRVATRLKSGKVIMSEKLLYTMGRQGNTDMLNLNSIGLKAGERGLIAVNASF